MKDRALYHLILLSARSVRQMVPLNRAPEVDSVCRSLEVERNGVGSLLLRYVVNDEPRSAEISSRRFAFYTRGDVPSLVQRRPEQLDERKSNWVEAHRLWGEILELDALAHVDDVPGLVAPIADLEGGDESPAAEALVGGLVLASGLVAWSGVSSSVLLGALAGATASAPVAASQGSTWGLGVGAAAGGLLAALAGVPADALRGPLVGTALLLAATQLAPPVAGRSAVSWTGLGASVLGAVLAGGLAAPAWWAAAATVVAADVAACGTRREGARAAATAGVGAVIGAAGLALGALVEGPSTLSDTVGSGWTAVAVASAAVLIADCVVRGPSGIRDRLSSWLAPGALGVVAAASVKRAGTGVWAGAAAGTVLAVEAIRRRRRGRRSSGIPREPFAPQLVERAPTTPEPASTRVEMGRKP
jgi:hypothetical protein